MKNYFLGVLVLLGGLFAFAAAAQAETGDIVVQITEDFVAAGKSLPAGSYRIHHDSMESSQALLLRSEQPGISVLLLPTARGEWHQERPLVRLTRVGGVYYLSEVATERGVFSLPLPRTATRMEKARIMDGMSASGSN